jgi:epoxyqueuosine reductase
VTKKEIVDFTRGEGADLVGIAGVEGLVQTHPRRPPQAILPDGKAIVVFALKHSDGAVENPNLRFSLAETLTLQQELSRIGYRLIRLLEKEGFEALFIPPFFPLEMTPETRGLVGDLSLRHIAVSAGLGFIGKSNLLITPEFGPRVRLGAVITNAVLETTSAVSVHDCGSCAVCLEKCPGQAISPQGVDLRRCLKIVGGPAGLGSLVQFLSDLFDKDKEETKKMIRSATVWNFHQALQLGISFDCLVCVACCPFGKKGKETRR